MYEGVTSTQVLNQKSGKMSVLMTIMKFTSPKTFLLRKGKRKEKDSPTPPVPEESRLYLQDSCLRERVTNADFLKLVTLPPSLDRNEWVASHTISFFNHVNLMYGVVSEFCSGENCSAMTAPGNVQYHWVDDKGKKYKYPAPQYVDCIMTYIQEKINDETVFPTKYGHSFPGTFEAIVKRIHRYLFQVLAHIFHAHYPIIVTLRLHGHLNSLFAHFMIFNLEFRLLEDKDSEVLSDLVGGLIRVLADPSTRIVRDEDMDSVSSTPEKKPSPPPSSGNTSPKQSIGGCPPPMEVTTST